MQQNIVQNVAVHITGSNLCALADRVSEFHAEVIERKLNQSDLTTEQKIAVINKILDDLKSREVDGIIK